MDTNAKKLMLVDETAFIFTPENDEDRMVNAGVLSFLDAARSVFKVIIVCDRSPVNVRSDLEKMDFSETSTLSYKIEKEFLTDNIQPWEDFEYTNAHVVISADEHVCSRMGDYDFIKHPLDIYHRNYFHHFWECYDYNLAFSLKSFRALSAQVAITDVQIQHALERTYPDIIAVWQKVANHSNIKNLAHAFANAEHKSWARRHPQDVILDHVRSYFECVSLGSRQPSNAGLTVNLNAYREGIQREFRFHNVGGLYPRTTLEILDQAPELPITTEHRKLVNQALLAIHKIVRNEPTKQM